MDLTESVTDLCLFISSKFVLVYTYSFVKIYSILTYS